MFLQMEQERDQLRARVEQLDRKNLLPLYTPCCLQKFDFDERILCGARR